MKVFAWLNNDVDGVACAVLLNKVFKDFEFKSTFFGNFEKEFTEWFEVEKDNYGKIFVIGMVYDQQLVNKLDDHKVIFVSDGPEKLNVFDSTWVQEKSTSCVKLLYKKFREKVKFSDPVKKFVAYADDYNAYTLKTEEARYINALFRKTGGMHKFKTLVRRFKDGFDGFTSTEVSIANAFFKELQEEAESLELYKGEYKGSKILAFFTKKSANEMAALVLDNYETDVVMVVNPDTKFVSFRRAKGSKADAKFLAENLCNGGGTEETAGGNITPKFIEFTQKLSLI